MRSSGILLPVSSLPSRYGIGTVGKEACEFVDFLKSCGQRYWQILPVGPTGYGDSPYQSFSAYAGNPYLIDLEGLVEDGLLKHKEIQGAGFAENPDLIDYGDLFEKRFLLLDKAVSRLPSDDPGFTAFCGANSDWLPNYALFMAIKFEKEMRSLHYWPDKFRIYDKKNMAHISSMLKEKVHYWTVLQFLFYRQWAALKKYANDSGIDIIGDVPIYVSYDSSDLWADYRLFQVNKDREMSFLSGCPPDYFNSKGQFWGNPLYDWSYHRKHGYDWWIKRLKHAAKMFDVVRIDHFRGFSSYYSIPAESESAIIGKWRKGPGKEFVQKIKKELPDLMIIAEDLGFITPSARELLKFSEFPGMKVLQFAFGDSIDNEYLPHNHEKNSIVYTGTHDNTTTTGWVKTAPSSQLKFAKNYFKIRKESKLTEEIVKAAMGSVGGICIIPIQDWLELGVEARINTPSVPEGNWRFRVRKSMLSTELAKKVLKVTKSTDRLQKKLH